MSAAATQSIRIRHYIRQFRGAGATTPEAALRLEQMRIHETRTFRRMVKRGIFVVEFGNRYWMDDAAAERYRNERRVRGLIFLGIILLLCLIHMVIIGRR